ncbi:MAG TPA: hypothetical protein VK172_10405 [Lentimicrobium sp.]|nr:hypothetical protein [Lentimicrobium sp.]
MRTSTKTRTAELKAEIESKTKPNTNWSSPKTNLFSAINDLRKCRAYGHKARLIKMWNQDCEHPIREKDPDMNFRMYKHSIGYISSRSAIKSMTNLNDFEKQLSLNYVSCFGTPEAVEKYYSSGIVSGDNFKGMGLNHLVHIDDMLAYLNSTGKPEDKQRAQMFYDMYRDPDKENDQHFYDFYRYSAGIPYATKKFKHKLWIVEYLSSDTEFKQPRIPVYQRIILGIISGLVFPLKYIPRKSVLKMKEYKVVTFRLGSVRNGYSVDIQIPNKFSFKD